MQNFKKYDSTTIQNLLQLEDIQSGSNFVKFPDGTAIFYGSLRIAKGFNNITVSLPFPIYGYVINLTNLYSYKSTITWSVVPNASNFIAYATSANGEPLTTQVDALFIAIGRWK